MPEGLAATFWWIPVTLFAALAQTGRNAAQRSLTGSLGTWAATLVRFLFGLPFALACLALLYLLPGNTPTPWPVFTWTYFGWIALGAALQLGATAALCTVPSIVSDSLEGIIERVKSQARPGTHVVIMSNGGFGGLHGKLAEALK